MKKDVKCLLSALVFAGISWGGYGIASAAGEAVYELNPVVVTATRTEKDGCGCAGYYDGHYGEGYSR